MTNLFKDFHRLCALESQIQAQDFTLKAENAALKEQVAQWETEYNGCSTLLNNAERTIETLEETITQQAEAIRVSVELMQEVESKYFALLKEKDTESDQFKAGGDMYGWNFHQGMRSGAVNMHIYMTKLIKHLAIQPSPDILQARDDRVAEACAKIVNPSSLTYITRGDALTAIRSNEWRKYL